MAPPSPTQLAWRGRIEALLRLAEPALNLLLAAGDRVSRAVEREDAGASLSSRPMAPMPPQRHVGAGPADPGRE
jgi:hypothetical protein